ncbi:MAG TPA: cytochrome c3 family protein [Fimbriimonadaceae bacterium]|jgi:hypothetical protein
MGQLFKPGANNIARASVLSMGILPWVAFYAGSTITRSPSNTKQDVPLNQPVPFSHRHHAYELGIDCRYCHVSVERTALASIPPTETCMSCHSQIWTNSPLLEPIRRSYETNTPIQWSDADQVESGKGMTGWTKVNKVPEFVYFNHSIHIARGLNCDQCHGPVQQMTITWKGQAFAMAWCLDCHRNPEKFLYRDPDPKYKDLSAQDEAFLPFYKLQEHLALTPKQEALLSGETYDPSPEEVQKGQDLLQLYGVKKAQLTDCWICHR